MDSLNKKLMCQLLNEEVDVTYYVEKILDIDGHLKKKMVSHYNCAGKEKCDISYNLRDCACFRDMKRTEVDINEIGNHSQ